MEAARAAVSKITGNQGHKTSVDEVVNPAVTQEAVHPHRHEETTQAVDREVHQHHYHTTVQPVSQKETLPEKHSHVQLPTEHKTFRHENDDDTKQRVTSELGRFQNHSTTHETRYTQQAAPSVTGERVHHHVHETVVPVIQKQTVQPEVVHTTVPIHETHHNASQHHGLSALPMKSLDEFKNAGGILQGSKSTAREEYEGQPRPYNDKLSTTFDKLGFGHHGNNTSGTMGRDGIVGDSRTGHRNTDSGIGLDSPNSPNSRVGGQTGLGQSGNGLGRESGHGVGRETAGLRNDGLDNRNTGAGQSGIGGQMSHGRDGGIGGQRLEQEAARRI